MSQNLLRSIPLPHNLSEHVVLLQTRIQLRMTRPAIIKGKILLGDINATRKQRSKTIFTNSKDQHRGQHFP